MNRRDFLQRMALGALGCLTLGLPLSADAGEVTKVYLVRHAEKVVGPDAPEDPPLTAAGQARASALARLLSDVELAGVHSTDTTRTRTTGEPAAKAHGVEVELYDHADPKALVEALTAQGGAHVVVGHSNTVPGLVEAFGGSESEAIDDGEYDRLYHLVVGADGLIAQARLRYGAPSTK